MPGLQIDPIFLAVMQKALASTPRRATGYGVHFGGGSPSMGTVRVNRGYDGTSAPPMGGYAPTLGEAEDVAPEMRSKYLELLDKDPEYSTAKQDYEVNKKWLQDPPTFRMQSDYDRHVMMMQEARQRMSHAEAGVSASMPRPEQFDFTKGPTAAIPNQQTGVVQQGVYGTHGTFKVMSEVKPEKEVADENRNVWMQSEINQDLRRPAFGQEAPASTKAQDPDADANALAAGRSEGMIQRRVAPDPKEALYAAQTEEAKAAALAHRATAAKTGKEAAQLPDKTKPTFAERKESLDNLGKALLSSTAGVKTPGIEQALKDAAAANGIGFDEKGGYVDLWGTEDRSKVPPAPATGTSGGPPAGGQIGGRLVRDPKTNRLVPAS